ncbi:protein rep, partial [Escherichia coli]|nr:protein rep [Escherichia coli]
RKEFLPVQGWIRTTEVTRGSDGSAHPHFHTLMMVPPSMLSGDGYVKHARWVELWREWQKIVNQLAVRRYRLRPHTS